MTAEKVPSCAQIPGVTSHPKSYAARKLPPALNRIRWPREKLYVVYVPKSTLPSGATTGEADERSITEPAGGSLVEGSTPAVAPARQPPGWPSGGISALPQPSSSRPRRDEAQRGDRSGPAATRK